MHPSLPERRRAGRIDCALPILLHSAGRTLRTTAVDLSRVGALVRIPFAEMGWARDIALARLGREASHLLGDLVRLDLHYEILGSLVRRSARPVRLGCAFEGQDHLEVGFDLLEVITDMEADLLGLPLPPLRPDAPATWLPQPALSVSANARDAVSVVLCNETDDRTPPLQIVPHQIDHVGARADLGPAGCLPRLPEHRGAAGVLAMLAETYGGAPLSVVLVRGEPVWSGAARFAAVEVSPEDHHVRVHLRFAHALGKHASARLAGRTPRRA